MTDEEKIAEYMQRYEAAAHAMQTGVAYDQESGSRDGEPKHLRVGVNSALVDSSSLGRLLIEKGVISAVEYHKAICEGMEMEAARYEKLINKKYGANGRIKLA